MTGSLSGRTLHPDQVLVRECPGGGNPEGDSMTRSLYLLAKNAYRNSPGFRRLPFVAVLVNVVKEARAEHTVRRQRFRNRESLKRTFLAVINTPPRRCNPHAGVELHTLTAHHHLFMYVTAVKSFLRFFDDIAVVVHDDGSLTSSDASMLREHLRGVRIIERKWADAEMNRLLAAYTLSRNYRRRIVNAMELFDNILLSGTERVITMNSDVLFLREPSDLIGWISGGSRQALSVHEERPAHQREFLLANSCEFSPHVTICLTCFFRDIFDPDLIERALTRFPLDWFTGQNMYPVLLKNKQSEHPFSFLDKRYYQASGHFTEEAVFRHYWTSTGVFSGLQEKDSAEVIGELSIS